MITFPKSTNKVLSATMSTAPIPAIKCGLWVKQYLERIQNIFVDHTLPSETFFIEQCRKNKMDPSDLDNRLLMLSLWSLSRLYETDHMMVRKHFIKFLEHLEEAKTNLYCALDLHHKHPPIKAQAHTPEQLPSFPLSSQPPQDIFGVTSDLESKFITMPVSPAEVPLLTKPLTPDEVIITEPVPSPITTPSPVDQTTSFPIAEPMPTMRLPDAEPMSTMRLPVATLFSATSSPLPTTLPVHTVTSSFPST